MARKELFDSMRRFLLLFVLVALVGCQQAVPTQRPIQSQKTTVALRTLTPQATATPEPTATTEPTATVPAEVTKPVSSPTPAKASTPSPVATPDTPPPTGSRSYCTQTAGSLGQERFSAQLTSLTLTRTGSLDVLTLGFDELQGPLGAMAACVAPNDAISLLESDEITSVLRLEVPLWTHDEAWEDSQALLTTPLSFEGTRRVRGINVLNQGDRSAGLVVELGVNQHVPFELRLTNNQLVLTIADTPAIGDDPLGQAKGRAGNPVQPLVYNQGGDLWLLDGASIKALRLTPEVETDFALSPNRTQVAFCRVEAGVAPELGSLWISNLDGSDERQLADIGGCADPAWAFDGSAIWFAAPWNDIQPLAFRLWEVPTNGEPQQRSGLDEWSRTQPQPLPQGDVLMIGTDAVGGSTILLYQASTGNTLDLGGDLRSQYVGVADLMLAPDGSQAAASALRTDGGADLIWLDPNGTITATVGTDMWWSRPLAWGPDGTLYSLASACQAGRVLNYTLYEHSKRQAKPLANGHTLAAIGDAVVADTGLVFVRETLNNGGERGSAPTITGPSQLWLLNPKTGDRELLIATPHPLWGVQ